MSSLTTSTPTVNSFESITFSYATEPATRSDLNWVGLYHRGEVPGEVGSTTWQYTPALSGTVTFAASLLGVGEWSAFYLYNDGYEQLAGPVDVTVTPGRLSEAPAPVRTLRPHGRHGFERPSDVAVALDGTLVVADTGNDRIVVLSPRGQIKREIDRHLSEPSAVAVDGSGGIWVADYGNNRIVRYDDRGRQTTALEGFDGPTGIAATAGGDVWIADQGNDRVQRVDGVGAVVATASVPSPHGVAVDAADGVWVSSPSYAGGNRIMRFDGSGARTLSAGATHSRYGALSNPAGLAVDQTGRVHVTQPDYGWVSVYRADGSFTSQYGPSGTHLRDNLAFPLGVDVGPDGHLWIADTGNDRLVEWAWPT